MLYLKMMWLHNFMDASAVLGVFCVQLEDCALQLYKHNGTQYEYSSYLDLETTLAEQSEELDGFSNKYVVLVDR